MYYVVLYYCYIVKYNYIYSTSLYIVTRRRFQGFKRFPTCSYISYAFQLPHTSSWILPFHTISIYFNLFHTFSYIFSIFYFHYSSYMFIYTYSIIIILFHTVSNSSPLLCLPWHWALYLSQLPADLVHFWEENPQEWNVLNKWNWTKHNQTMSLQ